MPRRIPIPWQTGEVDERSRDVLAGRVPPAKPRDAATVMLLRDTPGGVEVFMLRRSATMAFAPGAYVFPGGSVDPGDASPAHWTGPSAADFGGLLGTSAELAAALVHAAVRETFEESGVLLAGSGTEPAQREEDRLALTAHSVTLADVLGREGLALRADLLVPWARWITPELAPRRFDTRFFAAALPADQQVSTPPGEADHAAWLRPAAAIEAARAGELMLLPPTAVTLSELAAGGDVRRILAARRQISPVQPDIGFEGGQAWLSIPDSVAYPL